MANNDFKDNLKYDKIYPTSYQTDMHEKLMSVLDEYKKNNAYENREFLCYLASAIYLTYKKLFPQLNIYIPFRTKSDTSCIKNILKEFSKFIKNYNPEISFDTFPIIKDMSGLKIVVNDINFSLPSTSESDQLFNDPEIKELMGDTIEESKDKDEKNKYTRQENFKFIDKVNHYIHSSIKNGKQYFELKKELLDRIIRITPSEFTQERDPYPSFFELYNDVERKYDYYLENDSFPTNILDSQITTLTDLLNELRSRVDNSLHFAILRKTLPIVFNDPLIKNALQTSFKYEKESKKSKGFQAIYDTLFTPFGPVEVQSQSNWANYNATKGSSYHSGLSDKSVNIKDFFELVDPNDKNDLSFYLDTLDSISADTMVSPYELPEFETEEEKESFLKTPDGIAFLESEKYREMMKHIKFKESLLIDNYRMDTDEYLLSTALSLSPYMNVCSSGHTSFTTAGIHHKKIIGEFAEVLRKKDSNTCLRDLVIRKLENIIENAPDPSDPQISSSLKYALQVVKEHDEIAAKLPKDISRKNILGYAENLRNFEKSNSDLDFSK